MAIASGADGARHLFVHLDSFSVEYGQPTVLAVGILLGGQVLYRGLIIWNRTHTATADPGDLLNGLSATLAAAGVTNLAVVWTHRTTPPSANVAAQVFVLCLASAFVLMGTTLTVASMGSFLKDPRPWLASAAMLTALATTLPATLHVLLPSSHPSPSTPAQQALFTVGWVLLAVVLAVCSCLPERTIAPQPATTQAVTIGAMVVLLAGVTLLILCTQLSPHLTRSTVIYAALAVVGASTRAAHLIRDLATLAIRRQEALTDDLTGLANRRAFAQGLDELSQASDDAALLIADVNDFKTINDRHGHATGDLALGRAAQHLRRAAPETALIARLGGDEFAVLLADTSTHEALTIARRMTEDSTADVADFKVRLSIGIACRRGDPPSDEVIDNEELFRRADAAMYEAKRRGVGVSVYDAALDRQRREQMLLAGELADLFEADRLRPDDGEHLPFEVHYQPQIALRTGRLVGVEALVRWRHRDHGLIPPGVFIDLVERQGDMRQLTHFVAWRALHDAALWEQAGLSPVRVSVNLSASCLTDHTFPALMQGIVDSGVNPAHVTFEITETTLMDDPDRSLTMCGRIVEAGFGLSIDDYGTGYSSLAYLSDLPATELKIDRAFVSRIRLDPRVRAIVSGTIDLAHQLGLRIVAEGAEHLTDVEVLREIGCDEVQGYVYSPPLPAADLFAWAIRHADGDSPTRAPATNTGHHGGVHRPRSSP